MLDYQRLLEVSSSEMNTFVLMLFLATETDASRCLATVPDVHRAISYLQDVTGDSGRFIYARNLDPNAPENSQYNILRHAGTIYTLADYESEFPSDRNREVIRRASSFLRRQVHSLPGSDTLLAVWSFPQIDRTLSRPTAKLGGTGLGLTAFLYAEKVIGPQVDAETLQRMANFLVSMQEPNGHFHSKYVFRSGIDEEFESLYFPGEAAFGLILLYEKDHNPLWLNTAARGLEYLGRIRENDPRIPWDHWSLVSTGRLMRHIDSCDSTIDRQVILNHATQLAQAIIGGRPTALYDSAVHGFFTPDRRTTGTSTMLEGLIAFRPWISDTSLRSQCDGAIEDGVSFLLSSQILDGPLRGGFPRIHSSYAEPDPEGESTEVRIDFVHHAASALLEYYRSECPRGTGAIDLRSDVED